MCELISLLKILNDLLGLRREGVAAFLLEEGYKLELFLGPAV